MKNGRALVEQTFMEVTEVNYDISYNRIFCDRISLGQMLGFQNRDL